MEDAICEERELVGGKEVANRAILGQFLGNWDEL